MMSYVAVITQVMNETSPCSYTIYGRSGAACGVKGDPFDVQSDFYRNYPPDSFGFCVLGSVCTVIVMVFYNFGDSRGWWDGIKRV